ncbi:MAG: hypothetical protein K6G90_11780 [Clostridia bacterium]|nr:hypothetical protein [Clostridia bacterium]
MIASITEKRKLFKSGTSMRALTARRSTSYAAGALHPRSVMMKSAPDGA